MAFNGKASDSTGAFLETPEDVSEIISIISPVETPFLSMTGDARFAGTRVNHEWVEEKLAPNLVVNSVAQSSVAAGATDYIQVKDGLGAFVMPGAILIGPLVGADREYIYVSSAAANTLTVLRGFGSTPVTSIAADSSIEVMAEAVLEGEEVSRDISRPRVRLVNYFQIFKKDVRISDTEEAVLKIGIDSELDHQIQNRTREMIRDLEKAVIHSIWSGNTIGGAQTVRTMKGVRAAISTNVSSYAFSSIGPFEDQVQDTFEAAWRQGGTDLDVILCGVSVKRKFDQLNDSRVRVVNEEGAFRNKVYEYEGTYSGPIPILPDRWMRAYEAMFLSTARIAVAPLQGRSAHYQPAAKVGDSTQGFLVGEYTVEWRNEEGMARAHWPGLSNVYTP